MEEPAHLPRARALHRGVQRGDVQGLVERPLVHSAIAEVAEAATFSAEILETISKAEAERGLACDDAVASPEVFVRCEEMHRTALALRATGLFPIHFGHALVHAHSDGEGMSMIAVGGDEVIVCATQGNRADSYSFLSDVEVEKSAYFSCLVVFQARLFESPDPNHLREKLNFSLWGERLVDGRVGEIECGRTGADHDGA